MNYERIIPQVDSSSDLEALKASLNTLMPVALNNDQVLVWLLDLRIEIEREEVRRWNSGVQAELRAERDLLVGAV